MISKKRNSRGRLSSFSFALIAMAGVLLQGPAGAAEKDRPRYMVQIGTFETISGAERAYYSIPRKHQPKTFVCRSGNLYAVECGMAEKSQDLDGLFKIFKTMGLNPMVVKMDTSTCQPASEFFARRHSPQPAATFLTRARPAQNEKPYADLSDPDIRKLLSSNGLKVMPQVTTKIVLSNRDVNRITCVEGPIKDIIYSKEKGITVKTLGNDAFVKFLIPRDPMTGQLRYATAPSEFYVVCGPDSIIYTLIALPRNVPAQAVELASTKHKIRKNTSLMAGLPFERKVLMMVKSVYRDQVPDSFTVKNVTETFDVFRNISVTLGRVIRADGEGLLLKEYILKLKDSYPGNQRRVKETFFLLPELAQRPVGISLEHLILRKGRPTRLFIVEKSVAN